MWSSGGGSAARCRCRRAVTSSGTRRSRRHRVSWNRSRSTPSTRTCSRTRPGRPARRRAWRVGRQEVPSRRGLGTAREPWSPERYRWLFEHVGGSRCPIIDCSGGTEVGACFLSPTPAVPIKECSLGGPALGMAMDVVDDEGLPIRGEVGELVCRRPFPGMTRGFWRDRERYLDTYWRRLPGIWVHGDWALGDEDG